MKTPTCWLHAPVAAAFLGLVAITAKADWDEGDPYKMHYPQLPDIYDNNGFAGIDVNATQPYILADDFQCTESGPITNVHIWGSWFNDKEDTNVVFTLSIHADLPATGGRTFSRPGQTLWTNVFLPGSYTVRHYKDRQYPEPNFSFTEGWMDPPANYIPPQPPQPYPDTICFQYNFPIPPESAFIQTQGTIYWLDVQAQTSNGKFGWKTTSLAYRWNDAATWTTGTEPNPQGVWTNLSYPPDHQFYPTQALDLAFVIDGGGGLPPPTQEPPEPKWLRPLDLVNGMDVPSYESPQAGLSIRIADDFISDGRPIVGILWWGSYLGYASGVTNPPLPPQVTRPNGFYVRWYKDIPAGTVTNYSMPGELLRQEYYTLGYYGESNAPVVETYYTNIWQSWASKYEHEFLYSLIFTNGDWLEKEGHVYWLGIDAVYLGPPPLSNEWGWATTPPQHNWNDDAVRSNTSSTLWRDLVYTNLAANHPYSNTSVNMAFALLTDVNHRRAKKWVQPPDMILGVNMSSSTNGYEQPWIRADDFVSDGRRITDIHWWGSYPAYLTNVPGPVPPPLPGMGIAGFNLTWYTDIPTNIHPQYSMPGMPLANLHVAASNCHEVYYGTVKQTWPPGATNYEHEFQYYVDLLGLGKPWHETNGVVYWLSVQAVMQGQGPGGTLQEWGWKTTPWSNKWNDASVVGPPWQPALYPPGHPLNGTCDLAFELTTDEVGDGTNWWNPRIVIKYIGRPSSSASRLGSLGDIGAGTQFLQTATDLVNSNWADVVTNSLPLGFGQTNWWNDVPAAQTMKFYRVIQR